MKSSLRYFIRLTQNNRFCYFTGAGFERWRHPKILHFTTKEKAIAAAQAAHLNPTPYHPGRSSLVEGELTILLLVPHSTPPAKAK